MFHDSGCFTSFQSSTFKMCVTFSLKKKKNLSKPPKTLKPALDLTVVYNPHFLKYCLLQALEVGRIVSLERGFDLVSV